METWDREEPYAEVWEQPLVKIALRYGISAVALGKVCGKLQIPLPGRGYWTKKEFGKTVERLPLPQAKDLPIVRRFKFPTSEQSPSSLPAAPEEAPTDPEFLRIIDLESRNIVIDPDARRHKLVTATEKAMKRAQPDEKGILHSRYDEPCLELRVSKGALERALSLVNAVILYLEADGSPLLCSKESTEHELRYSAIGSRSLLLRRSVRKDDDKYRNIYGLEQSLNMSPKETSSFALATIHVAESAAMGRRNDWKINCRPAWEHSCVRGVQASSRPNWGCNVIWSVRQRNERGHN